MFNFGSTEQTVALYYGSLSSIKGPAIPEGHYSEMSEEEMKTLFVYLHIALSNAIRDGAEESVVESITEEYDELFLALLEASDGFREVVKADRHVSPWGYNAKARNKYRALAGMPLKLS